MSKRNQSQILDGYFYFGLWYEWDEDNEVYKDPIKLRFKQNDVGIQGVSSSGKQLTMVQDAQGRPLVKKIFTIKVLDDHKYKPKDNFKVIAEDVTYTIKNVFEDYMTVNSLANLQFKRIRSNKQYVLVLGEK